MKVIRNFLLFFILIRYKSKHCFESLSHTDLVSISHKEILRYIRMWHLLVYSYLCGFRIFYSKQILVVPWPILFSNRMQTLDHNTDHIRISNWYWIKTWYWSLIQQNILFFILSYSITLTFYLITEPIIIFIILSW